MRGGDRFIVIPGEMLLEGTIRTFSAGAQDTVEQRMREIFEGITRSAGASFAVDFDRPHPVTVNDGTLATRFGPVMARVVGREHTWVCRPITGAEDFSYFAQQVPGFYFVPGVVPPESGGHHTPTFYADDAAIPIGMRVMSALVLESLGAARPRPCPPPPAPRRRSRYPPASPTLSFWICTTGCGSPAPSKSAW
jgi:amidohydrolase